MDRDISERTMAPPKKAKPKRTGVRHMARSNVCVMEGQRLSAIVDRSNDAIIGKTLDGIVTSWNGAATRMFGYGADEMIGQPILRIVPFDLREEEGIIFSKIERGVAIDKLDTIGLTRDGRRIPVSLTISPLSDATGAVVCATTIARDLSEGSRIAEDLLRAHEGLRQARLDADSANGAKTEFLAMMSHEIRTPLNSITGFVDLLMNSTELTRQQRRYAELVQTANALLLTIVDDTLDFSKIEAGRLELELIPFSLSSLIEDMVAIVLPTATTKNLLLKCTVAPSVPEWVIGDPARMRQVLLNLLRNAVKFTDSGAMTVDIRMQVAADGREFVFFSIVDTGIGIRGGQQSRLFEQFSQADSSMSRKYGGTGLGLAICKRLVELMGGEIGISSSGLGQGSTAWFTAFLPATSEPKQDAEPEIESPLEDSPGGTFRILVVDDIDTNLEIAEAYLQDYGYQVDCVSGGLEALRSLGSTHYDLVLMDIQMPEMDGIMATRQIRALPAPIRDIPIIAMTGNVLPRQVRAFLEAGMNDHVGKPIERAKLYNNVRRWLPEARGKKARIALGSATFDRVKFDEFLVVVGREKAERIAYKFLGHLNDAFKSTADESRLEAHSLINTAGVLGLDSFVEACRNVTDLVFSRDPERGRAALDALLRARLTVQQTFANQLLPRLHGERSRSAA